MEGVYSYIRHIQVTMHRPTIANCLISVYSRLSLFYNVITASECPITWSEAIEWPDSYLSYQKWRGMNAKLLYTVPSTLACSRVVFLLHSGQLIWSFLAFTFSRPARHFSQYECRHCRERGSFKISRHKGHTSSSRAGETSSGTDITIELALALSLLCSSLSYRKGCTLLWAEGAQ